MSPDMEHLWEKAQHPLSGGSRLPSGHNSHLLCTHLQLKSIGTKFISWLQATYTVHKNEVGGVFLLNAQFLWASEIPWEPAQSRGCIGTCWKDFSNSTSMSVSVKETNDKEKKKFRDRLSLLVTPSVLCFYYGWEIFFCESRWVDVFLGRCAKIKM